MKRGWARPPGGGLRPKGAGRRPKRKFIMGNGIIPFAIKNLLNVERDILTAPSAGGGPTKSHQLAFRNPLH